MSALPLSKRGCAEFIGTALLVAAVVGSGIMGERLADGNVALALLANTIATGAALLALILALGGISGAHLNPAVTIADALEGGIAWGEFPAYVAAQCIGGIVGAAIANVMFGKTLFSLSQHARTGGSQWFSEFIATFGLLVIIWGCSRLTPNTVPIAVAAYIAAAPLALACHWDNNKGCFSNSNDGARLPFSCGAVQTRSPIHIGRASVSLAMDKTCVDQLTPSYSELTSSFPGCNCC